MLFQYVMDLAGNAHITWRPLVLAVGVRLRGIQDDVNDVRWRADIYSGWWRERLADRSGEWRRQPAGQARECGPVVEQRAIGGCGIGICKQLRESFG